MSEQTKPGLTAAECNALIVSALGWDTRQVLVRHDELTADHLHKLVRTVYAAAAGPPRVPVAGWAEFSDSVCDQLIADAVPGWNRQFMVVNFRDVVRRVARFVANYYAAPAASAYSEPVTVWRHYKGGMYERIRDVLRESDAQTLVLYRSCETGAHWVRPIREFEEKFTRVDAIPLRKRPAASAAPKAEPRILTIAEQQILGQASVAQSAEAQGLNPEQSRFESERSHPPTPDDGRSDAELIAEAHRNGWADFDGRKACKLADRCAELLAENAALRMAMSRRGKSTFPEFVELRARAETSGAARDAAVELLRETRKGMRSDDWYERVDAILAAQPAKTGSGE